MSGLDNYNYWITLRIDNQITIKLHLTINQMSLHEILRGFLQRRFDQKSGTQRQFQ